MLTLKQFTAMADSYGADLRRWPENMRADAEALLASSGQARLILSDALRLDEAITAAGAHEDAELLNSGEADAALARLRSGVAFRIAALSASRRAGRRHDWRALRDSIQWESLPRPAWLGVAASCCIAIAAGLLIGAAYSAQSVPDNLFTMLQPSPIQILAD
jgi:hypothetical protein